MTDEVGAPGDRPHTCDGSSSTPDEPGGKRPTGRRRRRSLIVLAIAALLVLVLLLGGGIAAVAFGLQHMGRNADATRQGRARASAACLDLEKRLNRLAPPGAAANPADRAAAIRAENAAIAPFLPQIDQGRDLRGEDDHDRDRGRRAWQESWRQLVDARAAYADALDRQASGGERAFFLPPQTRDGTPVLEILQHGPDSCAGVVRRLGAPDL